MLQNISSIVSPCDHNTGNYGSIHKKENEHIKVAAGAPSFNTSMNSDF